MIRNQEYSLLKELALEFRDSKKPSIFLEIIRKVDRLLLYIIREARKHKPYLKEVELQDLYHTAILGLHKALLKVKESEPESKLVYKIGRYVTNEITKYNRRTDKLVLPFSVANVDFQIHLRSMDVPYFNKYISQIEDKLIDDTSISKNLEMEFIRERFSKLLEDRAISSEEFEMLVMRFVNDMSYADIAKQFGCSYVTVSKKIKNILNRLRYEFRRRGWGGV